MCTYSPNLHDRHCEEERRRSNFITKNGTPKQLLHVSKQGLLCFASFIATPRNDGNKMIRSHTAPNVIASASRSNLLFTKRNQYRLCWPYARTHRQNSSLFSYCPIECCKTCSHVLEYEIALLRSSQRLAMTFPYMGRRSNLAFHSNQSTLNKSTQTTR